MLIISQDKNIIINFDNIEILSIVDERICYKTLSGETGILGIYKSPIRAKRVFNSIVEFYANDLRCYYIPEKEKSEV